MRKHLVSSFLFCTFASMKQYLTTERKEMYMKDFNENVLSCIDAYWKLDEGVVKTLIAINQHQDRQTIYSRLHTRDSHEQPLSYLMLSITKDFEPKFNKIVHILKNKYKEDFRFDIEEPTQFLGDTENPLASHLSCNTNEEHFNTSVFSLQLYTQKAKIHKAFWLDLENLLG